MNLSPPLFFWDNLHLHRVWKDAYRTSISYILKENPHISGAETFSGITGERLKEFWWATVDYKGSMFDSDNLHCLMELRPINQDTANSASSSYTKQADNKFLIKAELRKLLPNTLFLLGLCGTAAGFTLLFFCLWFRPGARWDVAGCTLVIIFFTLIMHIELTLQ